MSVKLLTKHHYKFLTLKGGCTGSSESTLVKYHIIGNHMSRLNCRLLQIIGGARGLFRIKSDVFTKFSGLYLNAGYFDSQPNILNFRYPA